jgi:cytochrome c
MLAINRRRFTRAGRAATILGVATLVSLPLRAENMAPLTDAEARAFFNDHNCNACHEVEMTRIGPGYEAVSRANVDGSLTTRNRLSLKIVQGGAGRWGVVPMPANPEVSIDEARRIVAWILQQ